MDFDFDLGFDLGGLADMLGDNARTETSAELEKPLRYDRKGIKHREYINGLKRQSLTDLIPVLPPPDTDLYIIGNGSGGTYRPSQQNPVAHEFGHYLEVLIDQLGGQGCIAWVSSWTMARAHALNMLAMLDSGKLAKLTVFSDSYFLRRESAVANTLVMGLRERGQTFLAFKNHTKIIAVASADGTRTACVLGSANLSSQPRAENYTVSTDLGLYEFLRDEFFGAMLNGK